jgi:hypothetical protein
MSAVSPAPRRLTAVPDSKSKPKTLDSFVEEWRRVDESLQSSLWELARIAASLTSVYGESDVEVFARKVGRAPSYVRSLAQVHRVFENATRVANLTFTHYRVAVRSQTPQAAITIASERRMSTRELEAWIDEQAAVEKGKLQRRESDRERGACEDGRQGNGEKRKRQAERWEVARATFLTFTHEQLVAYALVVHSRIPDVLHMETVEMVAEIEDLPHYTGERKFQLNFKDAA